MATMAVTMRAAIMQFQHAVIRLDITQKNMVSIVIRLVVQVFM
jgi:hypothetical protein